MTLKLVGKTTLSRVKIDGSDVRSSRESLRDSIRNLHPPRIAYTEAPIDFFQRGIGKNGDEHRCYWTKETGFTVVENSYVGSPDELTRRKFLSKKPYGPNAITLETDAFTRVGEEVRVRQERIDAFKAQLIEEVKTNPDSDASKFIREHATEMGLGTLLSTV
ncbi:MAG: hypothetical protein Q7S22_04075 [Candidatus Micrarchaeota archaeon]|nr:hypothetical protein [Candidatus Micrarchaeota archaeon]